VGDQVLSHFNFMQKFRFQYQFEGKGLENNSCPSVKFSEKKNQNGRQNPTWLPISSFFIPWNPANGSGERCMFP